MGGDQMPAPATTTAIPHFHQGVLWYSFPALDAYADRLSHGFSSRIGGVSEGYYASLNLGIGRGDEPERVQENYRLFGEVAGFDPAKTVFSWQTHGVVIREALLCDAGKGLMRERDYQGIDGLLTRERDLPLITHYADCTPLFFYAPDRHIAAVSHAGWQGTALKWQR
jgi:polyphenol oxidase